MKRPLSLLEVAIGLALTTLLLTALFSSFRYLIQTGAKVEKAKTELHGKHLFHLRLNQIFESMGPSNRLYTQSHEKAKGEALYFTFQNGPDLDPEYCGELSATLFATKEMNGKLCLQLKGAREEIFIEGVQEFSLHFFDPKQKVWTPKWNKPSLPAMIRIEVNHEAFTFFLPRAVREVSYS